MRLRVDLSALSAVGDRKLVEFDDRLIIVLKTSNEAFAAFAAKCPHGGYSLSEGFYNASQATIKCEKHGYKFCVTNGRNVTGEGYKLKTYTLEPDISDNNHWYLS